MQSNTRHVRANTGYKIGLGVLTILVSLFCFICDLGAFGTVGEKVAGFTIGFFGLADFAYCIVGVIVGFAIIFNFRFRMRLSKVALFVTLFALGILALQIWTSSPYVIDKNYGQYLGLCYSGTNTAGGMLYGLTAYPLMKAITTVGALVVSCVAFFMVAFLGFFPYIKKNVTYVAKERKVKAEKPEKQPREHKLFAFGKKEKKEEENKLYLAEQDKDWLDEAGAFDPLYPNGAGAVEDEERRRIPDKYSSRGLAREVLFGKSDSYGESLDRFNTIKNPENAFARPGASYSATRRMEMRNRLGIDEISPSESYLIPREDVKKTEPEVKKDESKPERLDMEALRASAKQEESGTLGYSSFEALKADQIRLFGERAMEPKEVKPQFQSVAYSSPETANPVHAEVEKLEVVRPTKVMKPELPKARQADKPSTMAGLQGDVVRAITGEKKAEPPVYTEEVESEAYEGTVLSAEFVAPAESKMVYPATPAVDREEEERARRARQSFMEKPSATTPEPIQPKEPVVTAPAVKPAQAQQAQQAPVQNKQTYTPTPTTTPNAEPDWRKIFAEQSGRALETRPTNEPTNQRFVGSVGTPDKSLDSEGTMYQTSFLAKQQADSIAKARKEAPPLSRAERAELEIEKERQRERKKLAPQKDISVKAIEKKVKNLESIDTSKERVAQVTIDQSIYQATPKRPYKAPPMSLLKPPMPAVDQDEDYEAKKDALISTLAFFGIEAEVTKVEVGPTFSLYTLSVIMPKGRSVSTLTSYENDIAMRMEEESVRVIAPIPGKNAVGIEVPNKHKRMVRISEILDSPKFNQATSASTFALGVDLYNNIHIGDVKDLPHMLVAGATGAGKSVCINTLLMSILYKASPDDVRLILIDPKRVEMNVYAGIPHLMLDEIVCDVDKAIRALNWAITEMNRRITFLEANKFRNIEEYNEDCLKTGNEKMPRLVIVVDELADLMALGKKAVEDSINRIARLARAVGIHLILATQRPSVDVISGTIKNNLPTRIAFRVTAGPDSRTVLDAGGAEKLLGNGDMLYMTAKTPLPVRIQGAFVSDTEVKDVVKYIIDNNDCSYDQSVKDAIFKEEPEVSEKSESKGGDKHDAKGLSPELLKAMEIGMEESISISYLQRRLGLGFQKAARTFDTMKDMGILVPDEKDPKRSRVNLTREEYEELVNSNEEEQ